MTSEVALLNRSAVALAADSAATVTYWDSREETHKQRFFKRANKIFNMASGQPVGLMTYGSGSLMAMPWEVLIKAYRDARSGSAAHAQLPMYAQDLFDFLAGKRDIFSKEDQETELASRIAESVVVAAVAILSEDAIKQETDNAKKAALITNSCDAAEKKINADVYISESAKKVHEEVAKDHSYLENFKKTEDGQELLVELGKPAFERLFALCVASMFRKNRTNLQYTGIVVAGYGAKQYLPQLEQFKVYGLFKNKLLFCRIDDECKLISIDNVSEIVPVAQSTMIDTFRLGADVKTLSVIDGHVRAAIDEFEKGLGDGGFIDKAAKHAALKQTVVDGFRNRVREHIWDNHGEPLRTVIGMFAPEELAELAETFVAAETLKERVTKPTETVSGPIDVAVITKGDGFIWIKRKHYFDPALNLRFVAKKQQEVQD